MTSETIILYRYPRKAPPSKWWLPLILLSTTTCDAPASTPDDAARGPAARSVRVTRVVTRAGDIGLSAPGVLVPRQMFAATSDLPGIVVKRVTVDEGNFVSAGQVLAVLDDALIRSQIAQQSAVIAQHRGAVQQARTEAARAMPMAGAGVLSEEAVQARTFKAENAAGALRVQEAQLRDLRIRAARLLVRAPVGGRVIQRNVRVGDISGGPQPMFVIVPGGTTELHVQVPEGRLSQLHVGMPAAVRLADGTPLDGRVAALGARIDQQSAQGNVRISLAPRAGASWPELRPGASGTARFEGAGRAASAVPESAVQYDTAGASVMVLGKDDRVRRVVVRTGGRSGGFVELIDGPAPGTPIVAASGAFVTNGERVTPVIADK